MIKPTRPSMAALQAFESAARTGSFTRAAGELSVTQGGVSRQIRQLEEQLGVTLFDRVRQRVVLTDVGRRYRTTYGGRSTSWSWPPSERWPGSISIPS